MAAEYHGVWLVNVYATSGDASRQERESFFNIELSYLLRALPLSMIIGGDFNCVLSKTDGKGHFNYNRTLDNLVRGFGLMDTWATAPERGVFTHYTQQGATRLDRIYVTQNLRGRKVGVETLVAAFTDHIAVFLRMALNMPVVCRGRGYWKMNTTLLQETPFQEKL
jgi:endonuclease/exonuclease/phosphatase family metal-dependent hydrolase